MDDEALALARIAGGGRTEAPQYRPGCVFRDGEVVHVNCKAKWVLEHGDALFEAVPVRSLLLGAVNDEHLAMRADCAWLSRVQHLGLVMGPGAPLIDLLASPHLGALRSLDLNWTSNGPAYFPRDLPPKTLQPLRGSPVLGQLLSLRTSVSSVKLLLEMVAAAGHLEHLGLRMQGGFASKDAVRIGQAMDFPVLRSLSISNGVVPAHAPALRSLRLRFGGLPDGADISRLEILRLDHVFAPALVRTLSRRPAAPRGGSRRAGDPDCVLGAGRAAGLARPARAGAAPPQVAR